MDKLLSIEEIETLYKEFKTSMHSRYGIRNMEEAITELIAIKINSLIRNGDFSANNYIDQILNISSLCEDIVLRSYRTNDSQIFFTLKNNVLSGHIRPTSKKSDSFINIIEINYRLLISSKINVNNSFFFKNLLRKNDIISADIYFPKIIKNLNKKYLESMNDRILYNMFIQSQFRKNDIKKSKFNDNEIGLLIHAYDKIYRSDKFYLEEVIFNDLKEHVENNLPRHINKLLKKINLSTENNTINIDYLFDELLCSMDSLMVNYLNKHLISRNAQNRTLFTVDLLLIKDIINDRESKIANIQTILHDLGNIYWKLSQEINNNIYKTLNMAVTPYEKVLKKVKSLLDINISKTFDVSIDGDIIKDCKGLALSATMTSIAQNKYFAYQIGFVNCSNKEILVHPLDITKFLSLEINYKGTTIYSPPDKMKNLITDFEGKIESIKQIDYYK